MRAFLTVIMGAMLLGGCAAKPTATSAQAVSAQEDKDSAGFKNIARENSPELAASEESEKYERAVADYNNCVLEHTANLGACDKQQAIMNGLGKVSSRLSLSQRYTLGNTQINNTTVTQGANTANTAQPALSQVPARIPQTPQATPSQTQTSSRMPAPISLAPPTTSSPPAQISPPAQ